MIDRISLVHQGEERYMCPRNSNMHCPALEGVPVGSVIAAEIDGMKGTLMSPFRGKVDVSISPEPGTCLYGNDHRTIPKSTFVNLPPNKRHVTFDEDSTEVIGNEIDYAARYISEGRANEITYALRMAIGGASNKYLFNPFRTGDKNKTAEMLAMIADYKSSGVHSGGSWISNFQSRESAMSVNHEHGVHLDTSKFANADAQWYRKLISEAVALILSSKKSIVEEDDSELLAS